MDYIIEAFFSCGEPGQQLIMTGLGVIKLGDLFSDVIFIWKIDQDYNYGTDWDYPFAYGIYFSAIIFTIIGLIFDLIKAFYYGKHLGCKKTCRSEGSEVQEENVEGENKVEGFKYSWRRYNLYFEEIPQLWILVAYFFSISDYCDFAECDDNEYDEAFSAALTSAIVTTIDMCATVVMYERTKRNKTEAEPAEDV
jgi:hypothetical protein